MLVKKKKLLYLLVGTNKDNYVIFRIKFSYLHYFSYSKVI